MDKAAFRLRGYRFIKVSMDFDIPQDPEFEIQFDPKGSYSQKEGIYRLNFDVAITCEEKKSDIIQITCEAEFEFNNPLCADEIPDFFYPNSLAILFPYIRAFISTVSLQANVIPILLPTINLTGLTDTLRHNTEITD